MSHQKVRLFAEAFAKIQEATAIAEIDELVAAFAAAEVGLRGGEVAAVGLLPATPLRQQR
jgi:hypothetical protein